MSVARTVKPRSSPGGNDSPRTGDEQPSAAKPDPVQELDAESAGRNHAASPIPFARKVLESLRDGIDGSRPPHYGRQPS